MSWQFSNFNLSASTYKNELFEIVFFPNLHPVQGEGQDSTVIRTLDQSLERRCNKVPTFCLSDSQVYMHRWVQPPTGLLTRRAIPDASKPVDLDLEITWLSVTQLAIKYVCLRKAPLHLRDSPGHKISVIFSHLRKKLTRLGNGCVQAWNILMHIRKKELTRSLHQQPGY